MKDNQDRLELILRPATIGDAKILRRWEAAPHLAGLLGDDDWQWEISLADVQAWRHPFIAVVREQPIGFLEIVDPEKDPEQYWGSMSSGFRAMDLWIGEPEFIGHGFGREMMRQALEICFSNPAVHTVLVDPLASNTASHRFYEHCGFLRFEERWFGEEHCLVHTLQRSVWRTSENPL